MYITDGEIDSFKVSKARRIASNVNAPDNTTFEITYTLRGGIDITLYAYRYRRFANIQSFDHLFFESFRDAENYCMLHDLPIQHYKKKKRRR